MSKFLSLTSVSVLLLVMHVFPWIAICVVFLLICSFYTIISLLLCMPLRMSNFLSLTSFSVLLPVMHVFQWIVISQKISGFRIFTRLQFLYNILLFQNIVCKYNLKGKIIIVFLLMYRFFTTYYIFLYVKIFDFMYFYYLVAFLHFSIIFNRLDFSKTTR
jgi:hypothetical protein